MRARHDLGNGDSFSLSLFFIEEECKHQTLGANNFKTIVDQEKCIEKLYILV